MTRGAGGGCTMAKKRIVSSKKNVPSHALSSKEAALQGRAGERDADDSAAAPDSPVSSRDSSVLSSDDEGDADVAAAAVEVMPASVGRGKQLRFPAIVSRGKEARVLPGSDADAGSDSDESLLSIDSDEEEDAADSQPSQEPPAADAMADAVTDAAPDAMTDAMTDAHPLSPSLATTVEDSSPIPAATYPVKAARARKRHRPDSGYYKQMSTFVRDCLLSVRDGGEAADVFREEAHHAEFRRRLEDGTVERVTWKEPPPNDPVDAAPPTAAGDGAAKSSSGSSGGSRRDPKKSAPSTPEKGSSRRSEDPRSAKKSRSDGSRRHHSGSSDKLKASSSRSGSNAPASTASPSTSNGTPPKPKTTSAGTQTDALPDPPPSSSALCSKCKDPVTSESRKVKKEPTESPPPPPAKAKAEKATSSVGTMTDAPPEASFTIPTSGSRDVTRLRNEANRLNEEARRLKHEGNRRGASVAGANGQVAQATYYLRSGAKFFENALKLQDVKAAYKELGDGQHARSFGEYSITTLAQTSSLIESTIRTFQSAGNTRLVALGYKMASVVHLAIHRLQHLKIFSLYSETFTPGRSPEARANGTTPPIGGSEGGGREAAVRTHLLKEMEHTLRGFEMWRRYEACNVTVLPRVVNPAVTDLGVFFEDLHAELGSSSGAGGGA